MLHGNMNISDEQGRITKEEILVSLARYFIWWN
jgi:hypothetical protein